MISWDTEVCQYMELIIREMKEAEYPLLDNFLYEAVFIPEGAVPPARTITALPELQVYIKDFGKGKDDIAYVAEVDEKVVGAVWCRIMDDYGHVDDKTPSLAMSILPEYRGKGIGTKLLATFFKALKGKGYKQLSLFVQKQNYAVGMYRKAGFQIVLESGDEFVMLMHL